MIAIGPFVERIVTRLGTHRAAAAGGSAVVAGLLGYGLLGRYDYGWIAVALALTAAGMRVVATIAGVTVMRGLPADRTATGAALGDTSQESPAASAWRSSAPSWRPPSAARSRVSAPVRPVRTASSTRSRWPPWR